MKSNLDSSFRAELKDWERDRSALSATFNPQEINELEEARSGVDPARRMVVYCVYENPFARHGGLWMVADNLVRHLKRRNADAFIMSPLHRSLATAPGPTELRALSQILVPFGGSSVKVTLFEHKKEEIRWILFRADGFFEGGGHHEKKEDRRNPYDHLDESILLRDSLFACAVVPRALSALNKTRDVILHAQDWQFASIALTLKLALLDRILSSAAVVLTSHNPYDHYLSQEMLPLLTTRSIPGGTVYQRMIPLTDAPVSTVSRTFAKELTDDPLQIGHFTDHLKEVLKKQGVAGVNNGLFGEATMPFSKEAVRDALKGKPARILSEKKAKRDRMLKVLADYQDRRTLGHLDGGDGRPLPELSPEVPIFHMFGRMDPGQKGFDILAHVVESLPQESARFVITPNVDNMDSPFVDQLRDLANSRPGEVVIYPFRMEQGYMELQGGATYSIMPSFYEPFGAATEPYLQGTPVVARATGGLVQQVTDIRSDPVNGTGILFREKIPVGIDACEEWRRIQRSGEPNGRKQSPLYAAVVQSLAEAMGQASEYYRLKPELYGRMLANGFEKALQFSWERAADEYGALYDLASAP